MATAAPHVKLLRQLASAKDDYLSGAFDISWDGAKATLYLVFGRPSHAVFETSQEQIEGEAAIDALLAALPKVFLVSDWRRAMSPHETLSITIDELAGPFVRLAGSYADDPVTDESPEWWSAVDDSPDLPFGLADFPLLPGGRPLWVEASPDEVHLADRLSELPPSILILTGAKLRAAAVVSGGDLIDAVWLDSDDHARGETAGLALLGATKGSLAGYALDDPRVAEALTMLWRLPVAVSGVELAWLDPASMLAAFRADGLDRVLVIDAPVRGIALFSRGGLAAVYSETQRSAVASPERLRSLLSQARGRLTVMERKPRPLGVDATPLPASAHDFFEVSAPQSAAEEPVVAEAEAAATGVEAGIDAEPEPVGAELAATTEAAPEAAPVAGWRFVTTGTSDADSEAAGDALAPPPPPPAGEVAGDAGEAPPPPPPDTEAAQTTQKPKRSRWGFGRSRKSRSAQRAAEEAAIAMAESSAADAATFAGWSVRQQNPDPQPVWQRSHDTGDAPPTLTEADAGSEETPAPSWSLARVADPAPVDASDAAEAPEIGGAPLEGAPPTVIEDEAPFSPELAATPALDATHDTAQEENESTPPQPDEDDTTDEPAAAHEPVVEATSEPEPWASASWLDDVVDGSAPHPAAEPEATLESDVPGPADDEPVPAAELVATGARELDAADATPDLAEEPVREPEAGPGEAESEPEPEAGPGDSDLAASAGKSAPVSRTPGPWSWPLAEPDEDMRATGEPTPAAEHPSDEPDETALEPAAVGAPGHGETASALDDGAEPGFFHRDEPVGSQYVDFDEVRHELVQIGIVWLGETNAVKVTALLSSTRSTIDDFVATIDTIRGLHLDGQDPASIQAMAREMHQQAAERLCGA